MAAPISNVFQRLLYLTEWCGAQRQHHEQRDEISGETESGWSSASVAGIVSGTYKNSVLYFKSDLNQLDML